MKNKEKMFFFLFLGDGNIKFDFFQGDVAQEVTPPKDGKHIISFFSFILLFAS
jgi:hypothetical protein